MNGNFRTIDIGVGSGTAGRPRPAAALAPPSTEREGIHPIQAAYLYLMKSDPDRVRAVAPDHVAYWQGLALGGYLGGPFADRSGGLITFECETIEHAAEIVAGDPFVAADLVESSWVKDWRRE